MSKKQNHLGHELIDVLQVLWRYLVRVGQWGVALVSRIRVRAVGQVVGVLLAVSAATLMIFDTIFALLLIGDPVQVGEIVYTLAGVNIFGYLGYAEYIGMIAGGVIMDLAILTLILWLGIYLYGGRNYFVRPRKAWLYASAVAVLGAAIFSTSVFYAIPDMIALERDMGKQYYENKAHVPYHHTEIMRAYPAHDSASYIMKQEMKNMEAMLEELEDIYQIKEVNIR